MTRFSVIVPVYNIEEYISQCITSILELRYSLLTGPLGGENKVVGPVVL